MDNELNKWNEFSNSFKRAGLWISLTILDSAFLALWVTIQLLVDKYIIKPLELTGIDHIALILFQVLFVISTLAPVAITIYSNIFIMFVKTKRSIEEEIKNSQNNEPS